MFGRIQRINLAQVEANTREEKENQRTAQVAGFFWNKETQLQRWNNRRHLLLRALCLDLASFETPGRSPHLDQEGWLRWKNDTGAAISAFPLDAKIGTETQANACSNKTASGVLVPDHGGLCVQGRLTMGTE